jgi:hypothetical protein
MVQINPFVGPGDDRYVVTQLYRKNAREFCNDFFPFGVGLVEYDPPDSPRLGDPGSMPGGRVFVPSSVHRAGGDGDTHGAVGHLVGGIIQRRLVSLVGYLSEFLPIWRSAALPGVR